MAHQHFKAGAAASALRLECRLGHGALRPGKWKAEVREDAELALFDAFINLAADVEVPDFVSVAARLQTIVGHWRAAAAAAVPAEFISLLAALLSCPEPAVVALSVCALQFATARCAISCDLLLGACGLAGLRSALLKLTPQSQPALLCLIENCIRLGTDAASQIAVEWFFSVFGLNELLPYRAAWFSCLRAYAQVCPLSPEEQKHAMRQICRAMTDSHCDGFVCREGLAALLAIGITPEAVSECPLFEIIERILDAIDDPGLLRCVAAVVGACAEQGCFLDRFDLAVVLGCLEQFDDRRSACALFEALLIYAAHFAIVVDDFFSREFLEDINEIYEASSFGVKTEIGRFVIAMYQFLNKGHFGAILEMEMIHLFYAILESSAQELNSELLLGITGILLGIGELLERKEDAVAQFGLFAAGACSEDVLTALETCEDAAVIEQIGLLMERYPFLLSSN
jgi:hypothetical protein